MPPQFYSPRQRCVDVALPTSHQVFAPDGRFREDIDAGRCIGQGARPRVEVNSHVGADRVHAPLPLQRDAQRLNISRIAAAVGCGREQFKDNATGRSGYAPDGLLDAVVAPMDRQM